GFDPQMVRGNAQKFTLTDPSDAGTDPIWAKVRPEQKVDGLPRSVMLRRGKYYEALRGIWTSVGTRPERMLVCGDIYELDLALPRRAGPSRQPHLPRAVFRVRVPARPGRRRRGR